MHTGAAYLQRHYCKKRVDVKQAPCTAGSGSLPNDCLGYRQLLCTRIDGGMRIKMDIGNSGKYKVFVALFPTLVKAINFIKLYDFFWVIPGV